MGRRTKSQPTHENVVAELMRRELGISTRAATEDLEAVRRKCKARFIDFVEAAWHVLEPGRPFVRSWCVEAVCDHLEAVTAGFINRLLINIPPGFAKSLLVSVMHQCWEWGPRGLTSYRYLSTAFAENAVIRDVRKTRGLIQSEWYQRHWPHVQLTRAGELSFENSMTGTRDGVAFASLTSRRADRLLVDDPHSVEKAESPNEREKATRRFREGAVNRLNDQAKSAIIVIMQRLHEADISGVIQESMPEYEQLVMPMEYEGGRHCTTSIGFSDPRSMEGELLFPERFPPDVVNNLKNDLQKFAWASQYQQRPAPRGGGIFPYVGWELWCKKVSVTYGRNESQFPDFEMIIASLDSAYGEKQENDFSALSIWGCWATHTGVQQVMLMWWWQTRLAIADLLEKVVKDCRKFKVQRLLVEDRASGISVAQEIGRLLRDEEFAVHKINPGNMDKVSRANALSHLFGEEMASGEFRKGVVWVPAQTQANGDPWIRDWAEPLVAQCVKTGTLIFTDRGVLPVEEVGIGDSVLTHRGRFRPILRKSRRPALSLIGLDAKSLDPLFLTSEHPLYAADLTVERKPRTRTGAGSAYLAVGSLAWVAAGDMVARRYVERSRRTGVFREATPSACHAALLPIVRREHPIDTIDLAEWLSFTKDQPLPLIEDGNGIASGMCRANFFRPLQALDYEFGFVLGLYIAEGSSSRQAIRWSLHPTKEVALGERVRQFLVERMGLAARIRRSATVLSVEVGQALLAGFFGEFGTKAHEKRIPVWMWDAPDPFLRGIFDGWMTGDGHEDRGDRLIGTTVSCSLVWQMRLIGLRLGISPVVRKGKSGLYSIKGRTGVRRASFTLTVRKSPSNLGATMFLSDVEGEFAAFSLMDKHEVEEETEVFNFDVAEDHSYVTTGGTVHNCASFPKGKFDDGVDSMCQALKWLRERGMLKKAAETQQEEYVALMRPPMPDRPLYESMRLPDYSPSLVHG